MREFIMRLNCHFSDNEKEKCLPTINRIIELVNLTRRKGILALEAETKQMHDVFLKTALLLVTDGTVPDVIKQIMQNMILADEYTGAELLNRLIMAEGVLALQQGDNPYIVELKLRSMLGEGYIISKENAMLFQNEQINTQMQKYYDFIKKHRDKKPLAEGLHFEAKLMQSDNRSIQHIIRNAEIEELALALCGCGIELISKVLDNVSMNVCFQICESIERFMPVRNELILNAQQKLLNTVEKLEQNGEIVNVY